MNEHDPLISWESLNALLPHDLDSLAKSTGAVERWRKIGNGRQLLWMCLVYAQAFMSLRVTAGLSVGFGGVTEGAVKYRLQHAVPFLGAVLAHLVNAAVARTTGMGLSRAVRLIDSTALSVPGSKGTDWRIHVCYVPNQGFNRVDVTDSSGAESAERGEYQWTDVCVGDQGYCRSKDLHHIHERGAYALVRAYLKNIRLLVGGGERLDIQQALDRVDAGDPCTTVYIPGKDKEPLEARLIIRALPEDKAAAARKKLRQTASRKGSSVTAQAIRLAGYFAVLTTVPPECLSDDEVLALYRLRWQIELLFKRWKSLAQMGHLPKQDDSSARAWLYGKLLLALLGQKIIRIGRSISPWGYLLPAEVQRQPLA